jgi:amino acid transporter
MYERSGGPYLYAREALGEVPGFAVGWVSVFTGVLAFASVARALFEQSAYFVPAMGPHGQAAAAAAFILALGAANLAGLKVGALVSDSSCVAKLVPLLAFVVVGVFFLRADGFGGGPEPPADGLAAAVLLGIYACSGFEFIPVPAGEAENARRQIPVAVVGTVLAVTVLYALVQAVAVGVHPALSGALRPLSEAAGAAVGHPGERVLVAGAVLSAAGFCAGSALVAPRYVTSLAEDGLLPSALGWRDSRGIPIPAIALTCAAAASLAVAYDFRRLVDVTAVVMFLQYLPTCVAVLVLRRRRPDAPRTVRLPIFVPLLAIGLSTALLATATAVGTQLVFIGKVLAAGAVVYAMLRLRPRRRSLA